MWHRNETVIMVNRHHAHDGDLFYVREIIWKI